MASTAVSVVEVELANRGPCPKSERARSLVILVRNMFPGRDGKDPFCRCSNTTSNGLKGLSCCVGSIVVVAMHTVVCTFLSLGLVGVCCGLRDWFCEQGS